ncbi:MAG: helix-turn-helix domain-containing protein [Lachnospiraceae bacterium]|nr:helix-turn-helix domain-containing protein [Lachnospiraceae bacterium]
MLELYSNIRRFRLSMKMSQDELAHRTGYSDRSSIAKIEKGEVDLPQSKISLFAAALQTTPGALMGEIPPATTPSLSDEELFLLDSYNHLNGQGKKKLLEYAEDLMSNPSNIDANSEENLA